MAVRSKTLGRVGSVLTLLCLIALLLSFASDRWVESSGKDNVGFENVGLWSVCFKEYYPPVNALVNRKYDGCWWVLNKELDDLRDFLIPSWFRTTQVLVTLSLVLVLIDCILLIVNLINCFPYSPYRYLIKRILAVAASLILILTAILLFIAILVFGIKSSNTGNNWLQNNDENYLSWSFGMCILADFLAILAGMVILLQFFRHRAEKDETVDEPQIVVTNEKPPVTNYQYSRNNANRGGRPAGENANSRDPAYVQRYYQNRDESKASLIRPPTETFAVSGRGEVYVNNMATYDDNDRGENNYRQRGPPPRRDEERNNGYPVSGPQQRNNAQPVSSNNRGRQLGRQGYPLRLQEPSFLKSQTQRDEGGSQSGSVYDEGDWKSSRHTSLPEYVPKPKNKNEATATEEDSFVENDSDNASTVNKKKKRQKSNDVGEGGEKREGRRKSRSTTKTGDKDSRERSRSRSNSRSRSKKRNDSDTDGETPSQRRRSKKKKHRSSSVKGESSDDEQPTRRRSRSRKASRSRSRSKDRFTSYSQLDSDTGSTHSRSRRKKRKEKELSRMDAKRRSASEDNLSVRSGGKRRSGRSKKKYDGNVSDDFSGSEYSQRRTRRKEGRPSGGETRTRQRDYSDNESVKSRSKRTGDKPKGTYSSYYEY